MATERVVLADRFLRGVYAGDPSVVDELAGDDIFMTYPIFERLFGSPVIRGLHNVRKFADGFCSRWTDAGIVIHESVEEGDRVVLIWSFRARQIGSALPDRPADNQFHSWGGITLFRFDKDGKIVAEIGEESEPGPYGRLRSDRKV